MAIRGNYESLAVVVLTRNDYYRHPKREARENNRSELEGDVCIEMTVRWHSCRCCVKGHLPGVSLRKLSISNL